MPKKASCGVNEDMRFDRGQLEKPRPAPTKTKIAKQLSSPRNPREMQIDE
jgi:hypothetical protein